MQFKKNEPGLTRVTINKACAPKISKNKKRKFRRTVYSDARSNSPVISSIDVSLPIKEEPQEQTFDQIGLSADGSSIEGNQDYGSAINVAQSVNFVDRKMKE